MLSVQTKEAVIEFIINILAPFFKWLASISNPFHYLFRWQNYNKKQYGKLKKR